MMPQGRPIHVVHVIGAMNRGGTETWLLNLLQRSDPDQLQMDFIVQQRGDPEFEAEVKALGARIILVPRNVRWPLELARALRQYGPYDIVHSHRNVFSAAVLLVAKMAVRSRLIAHSHTSIEMQKGVSSLVKRTGVRMAGIAINYLADARLATSDQASLFLFGEPGNESGWPRVVFCGVDVEALLNARVKHGSVRVDHLVPRRKTVGHVGAFKPVKNHVFMLDILKHLRDMDSSWELVLVGDGPLRASIESQAADWGLENHIRFMGSRKDVYDVLASQIDVFLFPSKFEGLGLSLVEAQIAGLPCVASDVIPDKAIVLRERVVSLPLAAPAYEWAKAIADAWALADEIEFAIDPLELCELDISTSATLMMSIYRSLGLSAVIDA